MPRLLLCTIKLLTALAVIYLSNTYRLPIIVLLAVGWGIWLWFVTPERGGRFSAAFGSGLAAVGWGVSRLQEGLLLRAATCHFNAACHLTGDENRWLALEGLSIGAGVGLMTVGVLVLAYSDYKAYTAKPTAPLINEDEANQGRVWPPAPKQPHRAV